VWSIRPDLSPALSERLTGVLSDEERARLARYSDARLRRRFLAVRGAVRTILGGYLSTPPREVPLRTGRWGKPEVDGWPVQFNLSHSGQVALLAVSRRRAVGIDVEREHDRESAVALASRFFRPEESAAVRAGGQDVYLRLWVRKEACVKAAGGRLVEGLLLPVDGAVVAGPAGRCAVRDVPAPPGYAAAVAVAGGRPYRLLHRRWRPPGTVSRPP
jgi:4'-phosphopantetheinyl transferase